MISDATQTCQTRQTNVDVCNFADGPHDQRVILLMPQHLQRF